MKHFVFLEADRDLSTALATEYSALLVVSSIAIAVFASYTAFLVSERISSDSSSRNRRVGWALAGSLALGGGVWAMHFIGMLAMKTSVSVTYDIPITLLSLVPAFLASLIVLFNGLHAATLTIQLLVRSIAMGGGIGAMHYVGMMAMRMDAIMRYDLWIVLLSVAAAVALAYASLRAKIWGDRIGEKSLLSPSRFVASAIMGVSISTMHYVGMTGMYLFPGNGMLMAGPSFPPGTMAKVIWIVIAFLLGTVVVFVYISRRLELLERIRLSEERMRAILDNVGEAVITIDEKGIIRDFNLEAENIFGYTAEEVIGQNVKLLMPQPERGEHDGYLAKYLETGHAKIIGSMRRVPGVRRDGGALVLELSITEIKVAGRPIFTGLLRDVTEKVATERELERSRERLENKAAELQRATRLKSEFLANMSHELRTPMNSIIGFTNRVIKKAASELKPRQLDNLRTVERNAHHLLGLINGLLDLSKIEAGKMDVHAEHIDFELLVREVFSLNLPMLEGKPVEFKTDFSAENIPLYTDSTKLKQILINLVSNAIKFTSEGSITIAAEVRNDGLFEERKIAIRIIDTGVGMDSDALQYVFDAFRQVDGSTTRKIGGTGLGLAIVHSFAELLGGTVRVESELGVGSTFEIVIPVSLARSRPLPDFAGARSSLVKPEEVEGNGRTILCIDDDAEVRELLTDYLTDEGYQVIAANSAEEGLVLAQKFAPFAITLDIMMPQRDGWSMLSELKSREATRDIPVIIISIVDNKTLGYHLGAFDYMQKPIDSERLMSSIHNLVEKEIKRVLVVDDDPEARELMRDMLEDAGIAYDGAASGVDTLALLEEAGDHLPDLITLDLMMPGMDGFELLRKIQENPAWANIPTIIVTAKTLEDHESEYLRPRVASILQKERISSEKVLAQLGAAMKRFKRTG